MKSLNLKTSSIVLFCFLTISTFCNAQEGNVTINQDEKIDRLLDLKKSMNKETTDRYKIQIHNGNRADAYKAQTEFRNSFSDWSSEIVYEPPNFKIWVGNFRTRLEADRTLKSIKQKFSGAFIFKPKKK
jgi:hypothetical protein